METLPNGVKIFNATPHPITFWKEGWEAPVVAETDTVINATPSERGYVPGEGADKFIEENPQMFVRTAFTGTPDGGAIIRAAFAGGADVVVGSIIAAQAYPGYVVAMTPAPGYERVAPAEKRMNPDRFTVF